MEKISNKRILLLEDIESENASKIIRSIVEINVEDAFLKKNDQKYIPDPIQIVINSTGGSIYDGLGIIGAIEASVTPVYTICYGCAMSMALFVLAAGHHRKSSRYSTLMYHELSTQVSDKMSNIETDLIECRRLDELCDVILLQHSKFKKKELDSYKKRKEDFLFDAKFAKNKGIIDEII